MNKAHPQYRRFLSAFALLFAAGVAAISAFVVIVDPYGLYGAVKLANFNVIKPGLSRYQTEIKQEHAVRMRPQFVILGNSRAEIGFDPQAPVFRASRSDGYNLAIPGTGVRTSARQLAQLVDAGVRPRTVILGVEFIDFLVSSKSPVLPMAPSTPTPHGAQFWRFDTLFSLASVKDAIRTLKIQRVEESSTISPNGFNPLREYRAVVRDEGYYKIFKQRAQETASTFHSKSTTVLAPEDFESLHRFLLTASDSNADVKLVIYPYHAQLLALFEVAGLWPLFEEWKNDLVQEIAQVTKDHPSARITLIDFSGFGPYNCERIPREDESGVSTRWYWEAGHFKKELGDIVLNRVVTGGPRRAGEPAFGVTLDATTQESNNARIAAERNACAAAHPEVFNLARQVFDNHF